MLVLDQVLDQTGSGLLIGLIIRVTHPGHIHDLLFSVRRNGDQCCIVALCGHDHGFLRGLIGLC